MKGIKVNVFCNISGRINTNLVRDFPLPSTLWLTPFPELIYCQNKKSEEREIFWGYFSHYFKFKLQQIHSGHCGISLYVNVYYLTKLNPDKCRQLPIFLGLKTK